MGRHNLKCQILGTQITQCDLQFNAVRHQSVKIKKREKINEKRGRRKVPRTASCASASIKRGKNFLVASKDRSERGAVPGQEYGKDRGEGLENATDGKAKGVKKALLSFTFWTMVPRWTITVIRGSRGKANKTGTVW